MDWNWRTPSAQSVRPYLTHPWEPPMSPTPGPPWPHCAHGANSSDPIGCPGIHVTGHTRCLAHLADADRAAYLASLTPGAPIDHRGTPFTEHLLDQLLDALHDPTTGNPRLGSAAFDESQFSGVARFVKVQFSGAAGFTRAQFSGAARFFEAQFFHAASFNGAQFSHAALFDRAQFSRGAMFERAQFTGAARFDRAQISAGASFNRVQFSSGAQFKGTRFVGHTRFNWTHFSGIARFDLTEFADEVSFGDAQFSHVARFNQAQFSDVARFDRAQFSELAGFSQVRFSGIARFDWAQFSGVARFNGAQFSHDASFREARFEGVSVIGPVVCARTVVLARAVFAMPVTVEIAAREVDCERTRWDSTAIIRLRYAAVDLRHAVLSAPLAITAHPAPFVSPALFNPPPPLTVTYSADESLLTGPADVRVTSVQGVDAAYLVLTDTDLTDCLFAGAFHLDQLRLEGRTTFASPPTGWHHRGVWPVRWSPRRALAEEHHWRAQTAGQPALPAGTTAPARQWRPGPRHPDPALTPDPEDVAAVYRQLRKAFEDGKNEPGAADFYYGECEMRRHDLTSTPKGERRLLWAYWLLSGYGLRASRAFCWLLAAMSLTVLLLMSFGLPTQDPDPATAGTLHGSKITLHTSTPDPALHGPWIQHMSWARAEKATRVAVNSVVFRSSGQNLTTAGTYIEMASRLFEPTLLALAALAVRGRIKR
ncbi:pentapeptide repeat-containing protein [Streptomyces collinus]|uniref:pentapeptide repeat-containing protein n=1 Tax=Streptomyces collinus TaxID=42684 RepID=UPI00340363DA